MNTELYIENNRLDIDANISALLNFALDDIKDFSSRSTSWSKTIVLPGTHTNNRLFGHIFQPGQANAHDATQTNIGYNFNAAKSADCMIFQDQIQVFSGVLRLLQINSYKGRLEYEVAVFGKLAGLNTSLTGALLENLDFSAYDHVFNDAAVVSSWDNPGGSGYYYPLIDYGTYSTNKHDWDIGTFRPALYVKELVDKMFAAAGFRYSSELFQTDRFQRLIVPYNKKQLTALASTLYSATINTTRLYEIDNFSTFQEIPIIFDFKTGTGFTANVDNTEYTYAGAVAANITFDFTFSGNQDFVFAQPGVSKIRLIKNDTQEIYASPGTFLPTPDPFTVEGSVTIPMTPGDKIRFDVWGIRTDVELLSGTFTATSTTAVKVPIFVGSMVTMNDILPKNVRQIDFLVGLVKLFNLYVYEDRLDPNLIHIEPYIDFYSTDINASLDWTFKLDRDQPVKSKPMSELNAKIFKFKFKQDNDYYNELYRKRYNEGYGDRLYDTEFEFADQTKELEIVFSSTPLVGYEDEDKVYSTIFKRTGPDNGPVEELVDSNIRIMLSKKITGVTSWQITTNSGATLLNTLTRYGYAGHLDDPDAPNSDINFGVPRELFFELVTGNLTNNQFNVYWSGYMREITDKDSKLLSGNFYLNPADVYNLDFSKYIYLDGVLFRLNSIKNYNASKPTTCLVELLKVNEFNFSQATPPEGPPEGNFLLWSNENIMYYDGPADDQEILWRGDAKNSEAQYNFNKVSSSSSSFTGQFRVYKNAALLADFTTDASGSLFFSDGDVVEVYVSGILLSTELKVESDVDGVLHNDSSAGSGKSFSWTVLGDRVYTITAKA